MLVRRVSPIDPAPFREDAAVFEAEIAVSRFLLQYAKLMLADVADERMAEQPLPGVNHPAWILGHLALTGDSAVALLGGEKTLDESWKALFGMGSQATAVRSDYPSKDELVAALEERFAKAIDLAASATAEHASRPNPNERLREGLPTIEDLVCFLLTGHFGIHLGQLSSWRRMIGMPPMF